MDNLELEKDELLPEKYKEYKNTIVRKSQRVLEIVVTQALFISAAFFWIFRYVIGNTQLINKVILLKLAMTLFWLVIIFNIIYLVSKLDILKIDFINTPFEKSNKWTFKMKSLWKKINSRIVLSNISKYSFILSLSLFLVWLILILIFLWINL